VDWMNQDWATRNCLDWFDHSEPRPLAQKLLAVPEFYKRYQNYLDTIARLIIAPESIFPHLDSLRDLITDAAISDTYRILDYGYSMNDFFNGFTQTIDNHTPYGIKPFLTLRKSKIVEQLPPNALPGLTSGIPGWFSFYPNPAVNEIHITLSTGLLQDHCIISDPVGKRWIEFDQKPGQQEILVPINNLPPGPYLIIMENMEQKSCKKLIKR